MSIDYYNEIEAHFIGRRGTPFTLNTKDWTLMQEWNAAGIPLSIVIEAMDTVFDRFDAAERKVNGLSFCKDAVKRLWKERKDLQIGAADASPEENPAPLLELLAEAVPAAFAPRIRELAKEKSVPRIEEKLIELEEELLMSLATEDLREEARKMSAGAGERTEQATLRRLVREKFELPRLTLFR